MMEQEVLGKIAILQKRIQDIADREAKAAWSKFIGITSDTIEKIADGSFTEEKMRLIQSIDELISTLMKNP